MKHTRRVFVNRFLSYATAGAIAPTAIAKSFSANKIKALAFDAFPIFDPRSIFILAEELFPGKAQELNNVWRTKQFDYQWLRALSDTYQDFWTVTQEALIFAAKTVKVDLTDEKHTKLMNAYMNLKIWPDVLPALKGFKDAGIKLVFLSNMTEKMLRQNIKGNDLDDMFDDVFSTDINHSYKPSPKAYQIAIDNLKLKKSEIGFVAFAGWDASGAKSFGYPTYWINRQNQPPEELGVSADWTGNNLSDLVNYINK
jgi:2-haloacid dehalogenase